MERRGTTDENNAIIRTKGNFLWNRLACIERLPARLFGCPDGMKGISILRIPPRRNDSPNGPDRFGEGGGHTD
jgi:hypothetical protein